jgi:hypothetical protein
MTARSSAVKKAAIPGDARPFPSLRTPVVNYWFARLAGKRRRSAPRANGGRIPPQEKS